jgi:RNA polymerase-interacting CarD/CdnL/TRCF family regulator
MSPPNDSAIRRVAASDLVVGLICADRDGNRVRIDRIDRQAGTMAYHFLNDELRVQEGVQEPLIKAFLAEVWYVASTGAKL